MLGVDLRQSLALPYELHGKRFAETQKCKQVIKLIGNGAKHNESKRQATDKIREPWPTKQANIWLAHLFLSSKLHKRRFALSRRSADNQTTGADQNDSRRQPPDKTRDPWPTTHANIRLRHLFLPSMPHKRCFALSYRSTHNQIWSRPK